MKDWQHLCAAGSLALLAAWGVPAQATTSSVFGPSVSADDRSAEYRLSFSPEEERFDHRLHYQHALSDRVRSRLIAAQARRGSGDLELRYLRLETQWQYRRVTDGWNAALRGELQLAEGDDGPHRLRLAWTGARNLGPWQQRVNLLAGREFGSDPASGVSLELRAQLTRKLPAGGRLGMSLFSDLNTTTDFGSFDEQAHELGPIYKRSLGSDWGLTAGMLLGISDAAPDITWRLMISRDF